MKVNRERTVFIATALVVPLALFSVLVLLPYLQAVYYSFTDWEAYRAGANFVGVANYERMLRDPVFWQALKNNAILVTVAPFLTVAIALFLSAMLNTGGTKGAGTAKPAWGSSFYRIAYFAPQVLSVAVLAVMFRAVFNPLNGLLNATLDALGWRGEHPGWLTDPKIALGSVTAVLVWSGVGFYVVILNAAIAGVPRELYEAARIDGAGALRQFTSVTLPSIRDTVIVCWVYAFIIALDGFALVQILTVGPGGPEGSTMVLGFYVYRMAFMESQYGYASAIGVALAVLTVAFGLLARFLAVQGEGAGKRKKVKA